MAELQPTDEFLVNRSDITYTQEQGTLMANLETTDKLLVNRSDVTYTITGQELIDSVIDPLDLTVTLAPTTGYVGFPVTATAVVSGGKAPDGGYQFDYQWYLADDPSGTGASAIAGATFQSYEPVDSDIGEYLGCTVSTTDLFSNTATDTAYIGPIASLNSAPLIDSVVLTETGDGSARFTSQTFAYNTVMAVDGAPAPDYSLKAKLSGSTFNFGVESDTITKVEGGGENVYTTDTIASVAGTTYTPQTTGIIDPENIFKTGTSDKGLWQAAGETNLVQIAGISFNVLKVDVSGYGGNSVSVNVNGVVKTDSTNVDNSLKTLVFDFGSTVTIQPITIYGGTGGFYIHAVYTDDVQLVDDSTTLTFQPTTTSTSLKWVMWFRVHKLWVIIYLVLSQAVAITALVINGIKP